MRLENIYVSLHSYGPHEGQYTGMVKFKNASGSIEVVLDPIISKQILELMADALVADALVVNAQKIGDLLASRVLEVVQVKKDEAS